MRSNVDGNLVSQSKPPWKTLAMRSNVDGNLVSQSKPPLPLFNMEIEQG